MRLGAVFCCCKATPKTSSDSGKRSNFKTPNLSKQNRAQKFPSTSRSTWVLPLSHFFFIFCAWCTKDIMLFHGKKRKVWTSSPSGTDAWWGCPKAPVTEQRVECLSSLLKPSAQVSCFFTPYTSSQHSKMSPLHLPPITQMSHTYTLWTVFLSHPSAMSHMYSVNNLNYKFPIKCN